MKIVYNSITKVIRSAGYVDLELEDVYNDATETCVVWDGVLNPGIEFTVWYWDEVNEEPTEAL